MQDQIHVTSKRFIQSDALLAFSNSPHRHCPHVYGKKRHTVLKRPFGCTKKLRLTNLASFTSELEWKCSNFQMCPVSAH